MALKMISSTVSDIGLVRKNNQDSSFAGVRLVSVCDGMGGHAGGDTASTIAIRSLAHIENHQLSENKAKAVDEVASMLSTSIIAAHDAIVGKADREKQLAGMGTTVEAVTLINNYWVGAHIGDSRAYLLRDGDLVRVTKDHSYVQHLIDTGRITAEEAHSHPQRNVVMRVLGDFDIDPRPDISVRKALPGDRWMLCSDGLCGVLSDETISTILSTHHHLQECAQTLVNMALKAGSTDNVTVTIADAYDEDDDSAPVSLSNASSSMSLVAGAVANDPQPLADALNLMVAVAPALATDGTANSPAIRASLLTSQATPGDSAQAEITQDEVAQDTAMQTTEDGSENRSEDETLHITNGEEERNAENAESSSGSVALNDSLNDTSLESIQEPSSDNLFASSRFNHDLNETEIFDHKFEIQRIARPNRSNTDALDDAVEVAETNEIPIIHKTDGSVSDDPHDPDVAQALRIKRQEDEQKAKKRRAHLIRLQVGIGLVLAIILAVVGVHAWNWSQSQYFVKDSDGVVAIYQGVNTQLLGFSLGHKIEDTDTKMSSLPQGWQDRIRDGVPVKTYGEARSYIIKIQAQAETHTSSDSSARSSSTNGDDE